MSRRLKKLREDPTVKLALTITTPQQARRGDLRIVDVANHSDADQRHMVRSGEMKTVRRQTLAERLKARLGLEDQEADACQWYHDAHEARYATLDTIAKYGDRRGGGRTDFDHMPKTPEQDIAHGNFSYGRSAISPNLLPMFERVVLHGWEMMPGSAVLFRLAARQLMHRLEGL